MINIRFSRIVKTTPADIKLDKAQGKVCYVGCDLCLAVKNSHTTVTFGNTDLIHDLSKIGVIILDAPSTD